MTALHERRRLMLEQREYARALAERVADGDALTLGEREFIAGLLRWWSTTPAEPKRKRGRPPVLDAGRAMTDVALLVARGWTKDAAYGEVADLVGVEPETVAAAVTSEGGLDATIAWLRGLARG